MSEKLNIIGGTPEEKSEIEKKLSEYAEESFESSTFWEGGEKTQEQIRWIGMVNKFVGKEAESLKIEHEPIADKQVRFLPSARRWAYANMTASDDKSHGLSNSLNHVISINVEKIKKDCDCTIIDPRLKEFAVLLHEALHESGHLKYDIRNGGGKATVYRVGYEISGKEDDDPTIFQGFNEGITDLLTMRLLYMHKDEIKSEFGVEITDEDKRDDRNSVWNYINRRDFAIVAAEAWHDTDFDKLWRGYFTGDMMQLRGIEKKRGKGALRILSMLNDSGETVYTKAKTRKIFKFFDDATSEEEREAIRSELLGKKGD